MVIECISIILIIFLLIFAFLRARRKKYAISMIPLMILPGLHLISYPISYYLHRTFDIAEKQTQNVITVIALIISCIALGIMSSSFNIKKNRIAYIVICGIYTLILALILILK